MTMEYKATGQKRRNRRHESRETMSIVVTPEQAALLRLRAQRDGIGLSVWLADRVDEVLRRDEVEWLERKEASLVDQLVGETDADALAASDDPRSVDSGVIALIEAELERVRDRIAALEVESS